MFDLFTSLIFAVVVGGVLWAVWRGRDTLHPLVFLMPTAGYMYVIQPITADPEVLRSYFTMAELSFVQGLNLAGVAALALGCIWGSRGIRRSEHRVDLHSYLSTSEWRGKLRVMGGILGCVGLFLYAYGLFNVGGFLDAYNTVKGGGRASSGYLRDFTLLVIPAIVLLLLGRHRQPPIAYWVGVGVLNTPLLVHGLLSARRGPTFMGVATLIVSWYLSRNQRPSIVSVLLGGAGVGLLLLVLVTFRGQIYLGSSFLSLDQGPGPSEVVSRTLQAQAQTTSGSEFVYGSYAALQAREEGDHYWGARYLTYAFIRPIPRFLWPTKYRDVGMESLFVNAGTLGRSADPEATYLQVPEGAAPGFVGDMYVEFAWGGVVVIFFLGAGFGLLWRRALARGGIWRTVYICALVLSLYFVAQTFEAVLVRFLVITVPTAMLWHSYANRYAPWARASTSTADVRAV
ncbi:oligosaccharide repeat unit polymerase [Salinibacter ruber]|uniref:hypothetical protein n=1 Tax=Salinibacter ruber TaxID=146919 RepID=UPI00216746C9|nr:hypothetical protein [Salinibacter ruber]MCS4044594.1 oligosaccharide repeat unit polymerase [Salinibacter ruber]